MNELFKSIVFKVFIVFFFSVLLMSLTVRVNGDYGIIDDPYQKTLLVLVTFISTYFYSKYLGQYDANKHIPRHGSRLVFRFILLTFLPAIMIVQGGSWTNLFLAFHAYTVFYILFELYRNYYNNDPPFYIGNTAINDKLVHWINTYRTWSNWYPGWYFAFKILLFILSWIFLIFLWQ